MLVFNHSFSWLLLLLSTVSCLFLRDFGSLECPHVLGVMVVIITSFLLFLYICSMRRSTGFDFFLTSSVLFQKSVLLIPSNTMSYYDDVLSINECYVCLSTLAVSYHKQKHYSNLGFICYYPMYPY